MLEQKRACATLAKYGKEKKDNLGFNLCSKIETDVKTNNLILSLIYRKRPKIGSKG